MCVNKLTIIGSDNGLSPDRRQAIIWTNANIGSWIILGMGLAHERRRYIVTSHFIG